MYNPNTIELYFSNWQKTIKKIRNPLLQRLLSCLMSKDSYLRRYWDVIDEFKDMWWYRYLRAAITSHIVNLYNNNMQNEIRSKFNSLELLLLAPLYRYAERLKEPRIPDEKMTIFKRLMETIVGSKSKDEAVERIKRNEIERVYVSNAEDHAEE